MKAIILLSAAQDASTGRVLTPRVEAQAIRIAAELGADMRGLHAGPVPEAIRPALGHGLTAASVIAMPQIADPVAALADAIAAGKPDIVLSGRRSEGASETGLLPYMLAERLGWPLLADAAALTYADGAFVADQALPKGLRRRIRASGPVIVTVHPAAPAPLPYAYGQARAGTIDITTPRIEGQPRAAPDVEERPHRPRARIMRHAAAGGTAAERLRAATEMAASTGGECLVGPGPDLAARAILAHLRRIGAL
ncbi:adenine nucleotide alpha hydrolase family protein [Aureimonas frigidaquae]|uniref:hypothetical protein n=1 Tax=Aureimonas frigidaquae TaxID=424757 RepID=UPI0007852208|nr:hypothetical protein [Aureimonas frigidaquae]